ncbi:hypothetical protein DID88_002901 [Monilinia fructigena]|uniref:NAD(P)-binding domain-containing protein n=1 Tax=Monilinia fructigena TaxID=38457 RepID=A0A395IQG1_9HELO|nr:hypothetical protein DID88_002901 [Monilinia fructigena]
MAFLDAPKVALVSGANGITGSAVLKQLSRNPIWTRIIAISRSPPNNLPSDPRIEFHSLDLTVSVGEIADALTSKGDNVPLFTKTLTAVDLTSRDTLHRVILQTGAKKLWLNAVTDSSALPNFYYLQEDFLWSLSEERTWNWNITMPFWISGYAGKSGNSWTTSAAVYFSLLKALGKSAVFPGGEDEYYGKWGKGTIFQHQLGCCGLYGMVGFE